MAAKAAELQVVVSADTSKAEQGLQSFGGKMDGILGGVGKLAAGAAVAGVAGLAAGFVGATAAAAGFEKSLSGISAVSGATQAEMKQISDLALKLGADTSFSASEAAAGIEELIKGGLTITDVMSGGAAAALDLAAAGAVSVADAAEIAANAVGQFNLTGAELPHVADMIAGAANASSLSVTDFKFSLAAVGAVANLVGFDFDDTAVAIAEMGKAGIKGSDAGTSLKAMLMNLTPTTKKAIAEMQTLGIVTEDGSNQFFDSAGNVKKMSEVQGVLAKATAGLTKEQRALSLEILFGSDGIRAAAVLANEGAEGYDKMNAAMSKVTAADVARERLNNLAGSLTTLGGSLETVAIKIGAKFTPFMKDMVDGANKMLNEAAPGLEAFATKASDAGVAFISAFKGEWRPDGVDADGNVIWLDPMVAKFGEIGITAGESWRTFTAALAGKWSPDGVDEAGNIVWVDPFVTNMGKAGLAVKQFFDAFTSPQVTASAGQIVTNLRDLNAELDKLGGRGGLKLIGDNDIQDIAKLGAQITAFAVNGVALVNTLGEAFKTLGAGIALSAKAVVQVFTGDWMGAAASADAAAVEFGKLPGIMDAQLDAADARLKAASATIAASADTAFAGIPEAAAANMNVVSSEVTAGFGTLAGDFSTGWDLITTNTTTELAALPVEAQSTMNVMSTDVTAGFGTLAGDFSTGWETIVTATETELPKVPAAVETNMAAADTNAAAGGAAIVTTMTASFGEAVGAAETEMPKITAAVEAERGPSESAASGIGAAIIAGIRGSLSGDWGPLQALVAGKVRSLLDSAKAALGIESPSADFRDEVGAQIPAGVAVGITQATPEAQAAAVRMAKSTIQIMVEELGANDAKIGAAARSVLQRVIDSGIDLRTALIDAGKARAVDFKSALAMELGANDAKVGAAVNALLKRATDSGVDLTTMSADVRDLGAAFQETTDWAAVFAEQAGRLDVALRAQIEPSTILTTQAMTRLSQVLGPIERQVAGGAISMETLRFKLVDLARATGLAATPWDDYNAGLIDMDEAMMQVVTNSASAGPQFEALREQLGTTNTITDEGTLKWLQLALALQQTPASTKVAATALQGVGVAAGSAFANVSTGSKTAFAEVSRSATAALPKVTTGFDTVGKEAVGTTTDVDKFGKEIETLKATKGAVDGLSKSWQDLAGSIGQALQKLIAFNSESGSGGGGGQGGDANIGVPGNFAIPTFADGGVKHGDGLAYLHDRERVLTMPQQHNLARLVASPPAGSDGGARVINITVPITGSLIQQSEAEQWIAAAVRSAMDDGRF